MAKVSWPEQNHGLEVEFVRLTKNLSPGTDKPELSVQSAASWKADEVMRVSPGQLYRVKVSNKGKTVQRISVISLGMTSTQVLSNSDYYEDLSPGKSFETDPLRAGATFGLEHLIIAGNLETDSMRELPAILLNGTQTQLAPDAVFMARKFRTVPATEEQLSNEFQQAIEQSKEKLSEFYAKRGFSPVGELALILSRRTDSLAERASTSLGSGYRTQLQDCLKMSYPEGTAVLMYEFRSRTNGEGGQASRPTLDIWLFDAEQFLAHEKTPITAEDLEKVYSGLVSALRVNIKAARDIKRVTRSKNTQDLKVCIENASRVCLPSSISSKLASVKHLIVVPAKEVGMVPFSLLTLSKDGPSLIDKMPVCVAPSIFALEDVGEGWKPVFRSALIIGNPTVDPKSGLSVAPLRFAEDEARSVASLVQSKAKIGPLATKALAIERADNSDLIYIAAHGIADTISPLDQGYVLLAGKDSSSCKWTGREILDRKLSGCRLVVLSACQTGLGIAHEAGTIGLARAFQKAGAPRVIMSLWSVDDRVTSLLMTEFIRKLKLQNLKPDEALQAAMREIKDNKNSDPALWAPFVLLGTPR